MRYVVEGEWTGYRASQQRMVHCEVVKQELANKIRERLPLIAFSDGTRLMISVREAKPYERVKQVNSYKALIRECLAHGVTSVEGLRNKKEHQHA